MGFGSRASLGSRIRDWWPSSKNQLTPPLHLRHTTILRNPKNLAPYLTRATPTKPKKQSQLEINLHQKLAQSMRTAQQPTATPTTLSGQFTIEKSRVHQEINSSSRHILTTDMAGGRGGRRRFEEGFWAHTFFTAFSCGDYPQSSRNQGFKLGIFGYFYKYFYKFLAEIE